MRQPTFRNPERCCLVPDGSINSLINMSIFTRLVSTKWKIAKFTPIHKGGVPDNNINYWPISVFSSLSKIFENAVHKQPPDYLENVWRSPAEWPMTRSLATSCQWLWEMLKLYAFDFNIFPNQPASYLVPRKLTTKLNSNSKKCKLFFQYFQYFF